MDWELDPDAAAERDAIVAAIYMAFGSVRRGPDGTSWSETVALDFYRHEDECLAARKADKDGAWGELVDDPGWQPFPGVGGFSFIDAAGFHYYLPPTMVRTLQGDNPEWYDGHLLGVIDRFFDAVPWRDGELEAIARFVAFMAKHDSDLCSEEGDNVWQVAIEKRWHQHLPPSRPGG